MTPVNHFEEAKNAISVLERRFSENEDKLRHAMKGTLLRECLTANTMASEKLCKLQAGLLRLRADEEQAGL